MSRAPMKAVWISMAAAALTIDRAKLAEIQVL